MKAFTSIVTATVVSCAALFPVDEALATGKLICRGLNRPLIISNLKKQIKTELKADGIPFQRVKVEILIPARPTGIFSYDFTPGIQITPTPFSILYSGELPNPPEDCSVAATLRITVVLKDGTITQTTKDYTLSGKLLFKFSGDND